MAGALDTIARLHDVEAMRSLPLILAGLLLVACGGGDETPTALDTSDEVGLHDIPALPGDTMDETPTLDAGTVDSGTDAPTDSDTDSASDGAEPDSDSTPDLPDADECERSVGCACEEHAECDSGWCVLRVDGSGSCAEANCDACPDGWSCEWRQVIGGERGQICVPEDVRWCAPCASDAECGAGVCLVLRDGGYCAPPCGADELCPAGSICRTASDDDPTQVCAPPGDRCIGCTDVDQDGYIAVGECAGVDCADRDPSIYPGAEEICDGVDNNCRDGVDEGWAFLSDLENCGSCGIACDSSHSDVRCVLGECVIDACDEGFQDCNSDGTDGCEVDVFGEFGCGVCPDGDEGPLHGDPCGTCGSGTWECSEESNECVGAGGGEVRNVCGGCAELEGHPGDRCGSCETGLVLCSGSEATRCDGDLGEEAENGCAGCIPLIGRPGTRCGTCDSGTYICDGTDDAVCVGDRGVDAYNDCGGCAVLPGAPDTPCGTCDTGTWACDGLEAAICEGEDGGTANACDGCSTLPETPGGSCGECDDGVWTCDGTEAVSCEGGSTPGPDGCADPACEGRDDGSLGESCTFPDDCCSGYCPSFAPSDRICSERCGSYAGCNATGPPADLFCARDLGVPRLCAIDDLGADCSLGSDCNGRLCLTSTPTGACSYQCGALADCAPGIACGRFNSAGGGTIWACTELGGPCTEPTQCDSGVCLTGPTSDYCTTFCEPAGIDGCPTGFSCLPLPGDGTYLCLR